MSDVRADAGRGRAPRVAARRLVAVVALLAAVWIVCAVVVESREPSAGAPAPHIRPLPVNFFRP
jgi:hypothetical protein